MCPIQFQYFLTFLYFRIDVLKKVEKNNKTFPCFRIFWTRNATNSAYSEFPSGFI
jgi:hypothetical protein